MCVQSTGDLTDNEDVAKTVLSMLQDTSMLLHHSNSSDPFVRFEGNT